MEALHLEPLEDLSIRALGLAISPWMGHRGIADLQAEVGVVGLEEPTGELRAIVGDLVIGHAESAHNALDELNS